LGPEGKKIRKLSNNQSERHRGKSYFHHHAPDFLDIVERVLNDSQFGKETKLRVPHLIADLLEINPKTTKIFLKKASTV